MSLQLEKCPDKNELLDYLLGKLSPEALATLESHFEDCGECEETIRGLNANDTLSDLVSEALQVEAELEANEQSVVVNLIQRLNQETCAKRIDSSLEDRAAEVIRLLEDDTDFEIGIGMLAHYQILELIGAGSTGVVFRAMDTQLQRIVALKVLRPSLGRSARERFMSEARAAASIEHPNVVTIYHVGEEADIAYLAMQWIPGETLEDRLASVTYLPESIARDIAGQIAAGLTVAHQKNLIHRDIKPANIWLRADSNQAIILDFGLARIADDDPQMTATGVLAGTPNFMSPEQTCGMELDGRSDLFSLGCLMYRALTGKLPFGANGILATLQSIQHHNPLPPKRLNPHVTEDTSDLVMCLLEKQPVNRPQSASQLIQALTSPREKWPFVAANTRKTKRPESSAAHHPAKKTAWTRWLIALILLGALGWFGYQFGPQIIRIATDHGQLIIESDDENVKIEILDDGKLIRVIDTQTQQSIDIKSGKYQLQVKDDRNSFELSTNQIVMSRGGKQIVSVRQLERDNQPSNQTVAARQQGEQSSDLAAATSQPGAQRPTYDGRTFDEWISVLATERNRDTIRSGLLATAELSINDSKKQGVALGAVAELIRQLGSEAYSGPPEIRLTDDLDQFFGRLPAPLLVEFIRDEIADGTPESRGMLPKLFTSTRLFRYRFQASIAFRDQIDQQLAELIETAIAEINPDSPEEANEVLFHTIDSLLSFNYVPIALHESYYSTHPHKLLKPVADDVARLLVAAMEQSASTTHSLRYAVLLLKFHVDNAQATKLVVQAISDEQTISRLGVPLYLFIFQVKPEIAGKLTPSLIKLFENNDLCRQIDNQRTRSDIPDIRGWIIQTLGRAGKHANDALPWLKKISRGTASRYREAAQSAIKRIERESQTSPEPNSTATVSSNQPATDTPSPPTDAPAKVSQPTYDGRTFSQWSEVLARDRNPAVIRSGLLGIAELARNNKQLATRAIEIATPLVRQYGNNVVRAGEIDLPTVFNQFFSRLGNRSMIDFVAQELKAGSPASLKQLELLLSVNVVFDVLNADAIAYQQNLKQDALVLIEMILSRLGKKAPHSAIRLIDPLLLSVYYIREDGQHEASALADAVAARLTKELSQSAEAKLRAGLAMQLIRYHSANERAVTELGNLFQDEKYFAQGYSYSLELVPQIDGGQQSLLVRPLIDLFENEEYCKKFIIDYQPNRLVARRTLSTIRQAILASLGEMGQNANSALPWLEQLANDESSPFEEAAQNAIAQIRNSAVAGGPNAPAPGDNSRTQKPASNEPRNPGDRPSATYGDRTFEQWASLLDTEKDRQTIGQGLIGLATIAKGDSELEKRVVQIATPLVREYGGQSSTAKEKRLSADFNKCFATLGPAHVAAFAKQELAHGTAQSIRQLARLLNASELYNYHSEHQSFQLELRKHALELIQIILPLSDHDPQTAESLLRSVLSSAFWPLNPEALRLRQFKLPNDVADLLTEKMQSSENGGFRVGLARMLIVHHAEDERTVAEFCKLFQDSSLFRVGDAQALNALKFVEEANRSMLVKPLIEFFEDEAYCRMFSQGKSVRANTAVTNEVGFRRQLISKIGELGTAAEEAVPWLEKLAAGDKLFADQARAAIRKIRPQNQPTGYDRAGLSRDDQ